ncbi:ABC transporter ATP-binding protein [Leptospira sp. GIMC2001]|uniref:ABC transporter ATP-binding protein n=1 Tax=Leptospira sp. GIMC2001 TaxID=1513297 RepID=UPI00234A437A|nr:dipeptide/oligopeptide/nickel ABC transporter ATP-binding protein [Leptospira sp. GIMC2001]WCL51117.1 dipeptide/oligopeptide/nickel ABC transporter ATP-binding protein [Leptospira sp. GIMC2001]
MLRIENLNVKTIQGKKILDSVSLAVNSDEIVSLVGGSGSGKSTIFKSILHSILPMDGYVIEGKVSLDGQSVQPVFQDAFSSFNPSWKMINCLLEPFIIHNKDRKIGLENIRSKLEIIGIDRHRLQSRPHQFSGGELQRLAILRSILLEPKILIMDEPVSGLDPLVRKPILDLIMELKSRMKMGILFISHDLDVVRKISDRIYVIKEGVIVESGLSNEIPNYRSDNYTKELFDLEYDFL